MTNCNFGRTSILREMKWRSKVLSAIFMVILLFSSKFYAQQKIQAFVFLAEECPISIYMTQALKESAEEFHQNVDFYAVFPNSRSNYKTMALFVKKYGLDKYQRILDEDQSLSKKYGATITPEAVVIDQDDNLIYRGRISNAYQKLGKRKHGQITNNLSAVLQAHLEGQNIVAPWPNAIGCFITFHKKTF